jgi:multidrug efflux pump
MTLTAFAVKHKPVTWVATAFVLVAGLMALFTLPRREDPDLQGRFVQITGIYPGASAQQVEQLLTDKVERALLELDDIKTVNSTSRPGAFVAFAEAADRVHDLKKFHDDIRHRISDL